MCLSTFYKNKVAEENVIMDNVETVETENNLVKLTDLFGRKKEVEGTIEKISLTENYAVIKTNE